MGYVAGIDLGTSSTKVLIMDLAGRPLGVGNGTYNIINPGPNCAEQDPEGWWEAVVLAIRKAVERAGVRPEEIEGIGFSGQMHGVVLLDEERNPICRAIIHLDQRSGQELGRLMELAGELMTEELLNRPSAGMMVSTLYWMKEHDPKTLARVRYVLSPKDYIRFRLCGEIGTDCSDASATLAFAVGKRRWCSRLLERLELPESILPEAHESFEVAGYVTKEAAGKTGLHPGTKVVYGAGDSMAALTGNGVVEKGAMACNIGTSSQLVVVADSPIFDPKMRIQTWCHTVPGRWIIQSGALNGGSTLNWLKNKILHDERSFADLDREAGRIPVGAEGVFFLPYLAGERTPYNDPDARGVYFGLGLEHERGHIIRATMEGVMFNLRECLGILDEMKISGTQLIASGGAARGGTWRQIQADMLNMPVHTTCVEEEACHGAAILAAVGVGAYGDVAEACRAMVRMSDTVTEPIPENVRVYRERQAIFHELYANLNGLYAEAAKENRKPADNT